MITIRKPLSMWNPWNTLTNSNDPFSDFFDSFVEREYPPINVMYNDTMLIVQFEVPGIQSDNIDVRVKNDTLIFKGERKDEALAEGDSYMKDERGFGTFSRSFALPFHVNPEQVTANYKDGILTVKLPKAQEEIARKISIKAN